MSKGTNWKREAAELAYVMGYLTLFAIVSVLIFSTGLLP